MKNDTSSATHDALQEWLDSREFYELCQTYRHSFDADVVRAFDNLKVAIMDQASSPSAIEHKTIAVPREKLEEWRLALSQGDNSPRWEIAELLGRKYG